MTRASVLACALGLAVLIACDDTIRLPQSGGGDSGPSGYHPSGFANPAVHGLEAKLHEQTCTTCHGADLSGSGSIPSCDSCHSEGWRTECTFCHGGTDNQTGAPPQDIDDNEDNNTLAFRAHTRHVETNTHTAFDCTTCHVKPNNVLSEGHLFDDTPAEAEVDLSAGLSSSGVYAGAGSCNNLYCHGNGRGNNGEVNHKDAPLDCGSCHASVSGAAAWGGMSGEHEDYLQEGLRCADCHGPTTADNRSILDPALHVNGQVDFTPPDGASLTRSGGTCNGSCHGELHEDRDWR